MSTRGAVATIIMNIIIIAHAAQKNMSTRGAVAATIGLGTMWMAVFADVGVTVLAVLNAMRSLGKNRLFYR